MTESIIAKILSGIPPLPTVHQHTEKEVAVFKIRSRVNSDGRFISPNPVFQTNV